MEDSGGHREYKEFSKVGGVCPKKSKLVESILNGEVFTTGVYQRSKPQTHDNLGRAMSGRRVYSTAPRRRNTVCAHSLPIAPLHFEYE